MCHCVRHPAQSHSISRCIATRYHSRLAMRETPSSRRLRGAQDGLPASLAERLSHSLGLSSDDAARWLSSWVALHDLGKASPAFQRQWEPGHRALKAAGFDFPKTFQKVSHSVISAFEIERRLGERAGIDAPVGPQNPVLREILDVSAVERRLREP